MTRALLFAANWKMHLGPDEARAYLKTFRARYHPREHCAVWFFPPAVSLEAAAQAARERTDLVIGAQDIHWEPKGALIRHSERRHIFGETDDDTGKKVAAALGAGLAPVLCVGETLAEREGGQTLAVVHRQLAGALRGLEGGKLAQITIAYEPVWAIGTGRNATPQDAAGVHREIRAWLAARGVGERARVLYGGSVNLKNITELLAEPELDGVLVGGASLDPASWAELVHSGAA